MTAIAILILLSACYSLVAVATELALLWRGAVLGPWGPRLWPVVVPLAFGWLASAIARGRVPGFPLLVVLAPAVGYSSALALALLLGRSGDPIGATGHLLRLGPHMIFAGAGALAWSWTRSRAR